MSEIWSIFEKLEKNEKKSKDIFYEYSQKPFRIKVDIEEIEFSDLKEIIKFYDYKSSKIYDYS